MRSTLILLLLSLYFAGCANFKPVVQNTRYFVLAPAADADRPDRPLIEHHGGLGIGAIIVPGYLLQNRLVIRHGPNEISYADDLQWAERLDKNIQRVLAAELSGLLGAPEIYLSNWRRDEVARELHVTVHRFEVNVEGTAELRATWAIRSLGGSQVTEESHLSTISRPGPVPISDPQGAVAVLSNVLRDFSREVAEAISASAKTGGRIPVSN